MDSSGQNASYKLLKAEQDALLASLRKDLHLSLETTERLEKQTVSLNSFKTKAETDLSVLEHRT